MCKYTGPMGVIRVWGCLVCSPILDTGLIFALFRVSSQKFFHGFSIGSWTWTILFSLLPHQVLKHLVLNYGRIWDRNQVTALTLCSCVMWEHTCYEISTSPTHLTQHSPSLLYCKKFLQFPYQKVKPFYSINKYQFLNCKKQI